MNSAILETDGLTKEFNGFVAVRDVALRVRRGAIHGLIGPNGAGKTTVFNLLTKFLRPSRGRIRFNGRDITAAAPADVARLGVVRSFEISAVFGQITARDNVRAAPQRRLGTSFHFWRRARSLDRLNTEAERLLADVGLADAADTAAAKVAYGRKRALEFATTLALAPELLLLDEPMSGLGHEDIARISTLIKTASARRTVPMVEHNLAVIAQLCDTITVLARGQVLAQGTYAEIATKRRVQQAYIGGANV